MAPPEPAAFGAMAENILREFEGLELSPYAARVLVALLRVGSANSAELARLSGVPRTSTYQIIEELSRKGLAERLGVDGPATWASPGRDEVLDRLDALQEERLHQQQARTARIRQLLASTFPETPSVAGRYVHVLIGVAQVATMYDRLVAAAQSELLVFNRPPYSRSPDQVSATVLDAVARGVDTRALYEEAQWCDPGASSFRAAMHQYHAAGVRGAVIPGLPIKLAVADRRVALIAMPDPLLPDASFPTTLLVEHPGFAALQAGAFDRWWALARPVETAYPRATIAPMAASDAPTIRLGS